MSKVTSLFCIIFALLNSTWAQTEGSASSTESLIKVVEIIDFDLGNISPDDKKKGAAALRTLSGELGCTDEEVSEAERQSDENRLSHLVGPEKQKVTNPLRSPVGRSGAMITGKPGFSKVRVELNIPLR